MLVTFLIIHHAVASGRNVSIRSRDASNQSRTCERQKRKGCNKHCCYKCYKSDRPRFHNRSTLHIHAVKCGQRQWHHILTKSQHEG